jgi:hypothetical protein
MITKSKILAVVTMAFLILAGLVYTLYKQIPLKGKATGVLEVREKEIEEIDKTFKLADINNDKLAEIILVKKIENNTSNILISDEKGNLFDDWPVKGNMPAIGDVNNDGYAELIDIMDNFINIYDQFGTEWQGFPINIENKSVTLPILCDVDKDGFLEIIWGSNIPKPVIHIIRYDGFMQSGWPREIFIPSEINHSKQSEPLSISAGDINNDGEPEIVVFSFERIFVFNSKGELISRTEELQFEQKGKNLNQKLILADFNQDKIFEAALLYGNEMSVRKANGEISNRAHIKMENEISSLILGDLNSDNLPEIILVMPDNKIYTYSNKGELISGWPIDNVIGEPVIGDVNSDGINEVITIRKPYDKYEISAYDINSKLISGWPIDLDYAVNSTLAICDIDDDMLNEIVFADTFNNIRIIKTAGIVTKGSYPQTNGNNFNNNVWEDKYMPIDIERGVSNKTNILEEASAIIPEFTKPEFKLLVSGEDIKQKISEVERPEGTKETIKAKKVSDITAKPKITGKFTENDLKILSNAADKIKITQYSQKKEKVSAEHIKDTVEFLFSKIEPKKMEIQISFENTDKARKILSYLNKKGINGIFISDADNYSSLDWNIVREARNDKNID